MEQKKFTSKKDVLLICGVLALAVLLFVFLRYKINPQDTLQVKISCQGETLYYAPLADDATFILPENHEVILRVSQGSAWFEHSDCPDQVCVQAGKLSKATQIASCLPNTTVLQIVSEGDSSLDATLT